MEEATANEYRTVWITQETAITVNDQKHEFALGDDSHRITAKHVDHFDNSDETSVSSRG